MKQISVLIIEDDEIYRARLKNVVEAIVENVYESGSAENATHFVSKHQPDLILLDNQLPKLNGAEAIGLFKEISPDSKIVLMSSKFSLEEVEYAIQHEGDYFIEKKDLSEVHLNDLIDATIEAQASPKSIWSILNFFKKESNNKGVRKIAIVDDDELFSFSIRWTIEQRQAQKNNITCFADLKSFKNSHSKDSYDLVFLDYHLPDGNSMEILSDIKAQNSDTKVIMISSQKDVEVAIKLKEMNCDNYFVKDDNWQNKLQECLVKYEI